MFFEVQMAQGLIYGQEIPFVFNTYKGIVTGSDNITVQLIQIAKAIKLLKLRRLELDKTKATRRLNIHCAPVDNTVTMANNPIKLQFILFSRYFMSSCFG